jgi:hypothetical protein
VTQLEILATWEVEIGIIEGQGQSKQIAHKIPCPKSPNKMDWMYGSTGRTSALQVLLLEFKPQYHQKKKIANHL